MTLAILYGIGFYLVAFHLLAVDPALTRRLCAVCKTPDRDVLVAFVASALWPVLLVAYLAGLLWSGLGLLRGTGAWW